MRYPTRASEPVHRRLWVPPSPLHDPSVQELHDESTWRRETVRCVLDWGHQNGLSTYPFDRQCTVGRHDQSTIRQVFNGHFAVGRQNMRSSPDTIMIRTST